MSFALAAKAVFIVALHIGSTTCRNYEKPDEGDTDLNDFSTCYALLARGSHTKKVNLGSGHKYRFKVLRSKGRHWLFVTAIINDYELTICDVSSQRVTNRIPFGGGGFPMEFARLRGEQLIMTEQSHTYMTHPPRDDIYRAYSCTGSNWTEFGWFQKVGKSWHFLSKPW